MLGAGLICQDTDTAQLLCSFIRTRLGTMDKFLHLHLSKRPDDRIICMLHWSKETANMNDLIRSYYASDVDSGHITVQEDIVEDATKTVHWADDFPHGLTPEQIAEQREQCKACADESWAKDFGTAK